MHIILVTPPGSGTLEALEILELMGFKRLYLRLDTGGSSSPELEYSSGDEEQHPYEDFLAVESDDDIVSQTPTELDRRHNLLLLTEGGFNTTPGEILTFEELTETVVQSWRDNRVILGVSRLDQITKLRKRPGVYVLALNGETLYRHWNWVKDNIRSEAAMKADVWSKASAGQESLREFLVQDRELFYRWCPKLQINVGLSACLQNADAVVTTSMESTWRLQDQLQKLSPLITKDTRLPWPAFFMQIALDVANRTNCMKRKVGAMVVKNNQIISTGYNGTPQGAVNCYQGGCDRCNKGYGASQQQHLCRCIHAEENALIEAGKDRTKDADLYCTVMPCVQCSLKLVRYGIKRVIYFEPYADDREACKLLGSSGIELIHYQTV